MPPVFQHEVKISSDVVDQNGHANNVAYVQWMQDAAVHHSEVSGCLRWTREARATWVVRSHRIEYLRPILAGESVTVLTWVVHFRRATSLRRYRFVRSRDQAVLAQGETEWVFVDAASGRPRLIPPQVKAAFELLPEGPEPGASSNGQSTFGPL